MLSSVLTLGNNKEGDDREKPIFGQSLGLVRSSKRLSPGLVRPRLIDCSKCGYTSLLSHGTPRLPQLWTASHIGRNAPFSITGLARSNSLLVFESNRD